MKFFILMVLIQLIVGFIKKKASGEEEMLSADPFPDELLSDEVGSLRQEQQAGDAQERAFDLQAWVRRGSAERVLAQQEQLLAEIELQEERLREALRGEASPLQERLQQVVYQLLKERPQRVSAAEEALAEQRSALVALKKLSRQLSLFEELITRDPPQDPLSGALASALSGLAAPQSSAARFFSEAPLVLPPALAAQRELQDAFSGPLFSEQSFSRLQRWPLECGRLSVQFLQRSPELDQELSLSLSPHGGSHPSPFIGDGRLEWDLDALFAHHRVTYWRDLMVIAYGGEAGCELLLREQLSSRERRGELNFRGGEAPATPPSVLRLCLAERYAAQLGLSFPEWERPRQLILRLDYHQVPVPLSFFDEALKRALNSLLARRFSAYGGNPLTQAAGDSGETNARQLLAGQALQGSSLSRWRGLSLALERDPQTQERSLKRFQEQILRGGEGRELGQGDAGALHEEILSALIFGEIFLAPKRPNMPSSYRP